MTEETTPGWLSTLITDSSAGMEQVGAGGYLIILTASLASSFLISALYLKFYGSRATGSQIHRAFPLIGLSVTAIFTSIQFSLPLSLGLLGALSIVRFRTPIKEPEEIGFIMLVVAASIAVATFSISFLLMLLIFAIAALFIQRSGFKLVNRTLDDGLLLLSLPTTRYQQISAQIRDFLNQELVQPRVESITKSGDDSVISYSFRGLTADDPVTVQLAMAELIQEGDVNVYMNKQATL